ncbi:MAG: hypothetical protein IT374_26280 [Polyangiaceae bacterium]|nr:hypothetical protein [Polyangiaceae bacterium]
MANALYTIGKKKFLDADIDISASNIKFVFTDHGADTPNTTTDDFLDDISAGTIATSGNLSSKTTTGGTFDAADETVSGVTGATVESINIYYDSGAAGTSPLFVYIDTGTGLPFTPDGGNRTVAWHATGIFTWT